MLVTGTQLLAFYLNLPKDATGTVCHQFGLLSTDLHRIQASSLVIISSAWGLSLFKMTFSVTLND